MKKNLILLSLLASCASPPADQPAEEKQPMDLASATVAYTPDSLVGKTIEYRYGSDVYHVTIDTDSTLHWRGIEGGEKGVTGNETYFMESLDPSRIFISWDEANGIAVSQVLDFSQGKVYNHLMINRALRNGHGEIRLLP